MNQKIIWTAVSAAVLSAASILFAVWRPELSVPVGLAAIANAILATRD